METSVVTTEQDQRVSDRRRRAKALTALRRAKTPDDTRLAPVDAEKLGAFRAEEDAIAKRGGCATGRSVDRYAVDRLTLVDVDDVQPSVTAGKECTALDDGRRAANLVVDLMFPDDRARLGIEAVECGIL